MRRSDRARARTRGDGHLRSGRHVVPDRGLSVGQDAGYVTAETAVVVPSLVLLLGMLLWGMTAAVGMVQCVDGARTGARAAARGEKAEAVRQVVHSVAPPGAEVAIRREGDLVRVMVEARTSGPGALTLPLEAEAVAFAEDVLVLPGDGGGVPARERSGGER